MFLIYLRIGKSFINTFIYYLHQLMSMVGNTDQVVFLYMTHLLTYTYPFITLKDWSHGVLEPHDEQWVPENREGLDVRRRLWFITLSAKDDATKCKQILTEAIRRHPRGIIMRGELSRMEKGTH